MKQCPYCQGEGGWYEGMDGDREWTLCATCNGSGLVDDND